MKSFLILIPLLVTTAIYAGGDKNRWGEDGPPKDAAPPAPQPKPEKNTGLDCEAILEAWLAGEKVNEKLLEKCG
jgi:hypothetical protein